jgi:hypothetical protein
MKSSSVTKFYSILAVIALCCTLQNAFAGEKKTISYTFATGKVTQRLALPFADRPGHELAVYTREDLPATSSDPEWDGSTSVVTAQTDLVKGSGSVWNYAIRTLKSGDKIYLKADGTIKRTSDGDNWKSTGQFTLEIYGGTGKYANAKGSGVATSESGPSGGTVNATLTIEY